MTLLEELNSLGVNTAEGLSRVMDDSDLYDMMLGMFLDSVQSNPIAPEEFAGELEPVITKVHALKGVAGNLSLTPVFNGYNKTLELLRSGEAETAKREFEALLPSQEAIIRCIKKHKGL